MSTMAEPPKEFLGPDWVEVGQTIGGGMRRSLAPRACDSSHLKGKPAFAGTLPETDVFESDINETYKPGISRAAGSISPSKETTPSPTKRANGHTRTIVAKGIAPSTLNLPSFNLDVLVQSRPGKFGKPITSLLTSTPSRKLVKNAYKSISIPPLPKKRSKKTGKAKSPSKAAPAAAEEATDANANADDDAADAADADADAEGGSAEPDVSADGEGKGAEGAEGTDAEGGSAEPDASADREGNGAEGADAAAATEPAAAAATEPAATDAAGEAA